MKSSRELAKTLKNIGPVMAQKLIDAGINSREQLIELGAVDAYLAMYPDGDKYGDFNAAYMMALEGAIQDCDWQSLAEAEKSSFKAIAHKLQRSRKKD